MRQCQRLLFFRLIMLVTPQHTQFSSQEIIKKIRDWRWRHCCLSWREELNSCFSHSCFHQHWAPPTISLTSRDLSLQVCNISFRNIFKYFAILGCNKLQRKLLFADSLAKLPYKITGIREVLSNMLSLFANLQYKNERSANNE